MNRGRNLELENETSKFRPHFYVKKPRNCAVFALLLPQNKMRFEKAKRRKSLCKN